MVLSFNPEPSIENDSLKPLSFLSLPMMLLIIPVLLLGVLMPAAATAAESPAGIQYQYSARPESEVLPGGGAYESATEFPGKGIPVLLVAAVLLAAGGFGLIRYRRSGGDWKKAVRPVVPAALAGAVLVVVLSFGATGTTAAPTPKAPKGFLNIAPQEPFNTVDTQRMSVGGIRSIRVAIGWDLIQPTRGEFDWGLLDQAVHDAAQEGLTIMPVLYATPKWVAPKSTILPTSNSQLAAWRDFVSAAVQRYGRNGAFWDEPYQDLVAYMPVRNWQVGNEVNFHYFATPVSARNYAKMLKVASTAIRGNDSRAQVMVSGLYGRPKGKPSRALPAATFIEQLGRLVPARFFDSVALHPYSPNMKQLELLISGFRKSMNKAGYRSKPIQVTEIGWASGPKKNAFLLGSEAAQAKMLTESLSWLIRMRKKYRISSVYWYSWKDTNPKGVNCSFCYTIGLFKYSSADKLIPKQAWRSFVRLTGGRP